MEDSAHLQHQLKLKLSTTKLLDIVKDILDSNRTQANKKKQRILVDVDEKYALYCDGFKLSEALDNVLSNAIKYSEPKSHINIRAYKEKQKICISISDQGQGFSELELERLFTPFSKMSSIPTADESSSGLGLSIVKMIIDAHEAEIEVKSEGKGKGSEFIVSFPVQ